MEHGQEARRVIDELSGSVWAFATLTAALEAGLAQLRSTDLQSRQLIDGARNRDLAPGWRHTDPMLLEAQGRSGQGAMPAMIAALRTARRSTWPMWLRWSFPSGLCGRAGQGVAGPAARWLGEHALFLGGTFRAIVAQRPPEPGEQGCWLVWRSGVDEQLPRPSSERGARMYPIRERYFRRGEDSDITDEHGRPVLHVDGKVRLAGRAAAAGEERAS